MKALTLQYSDHPAPSSAPRRELRRRSLLMLAFLGSACATIKPMPPDPYAGPESIQAQVAPIAARQVGREIVACGRRFDIGVPVILWTDPGGYDAYGGRQASIITGAEARGLRPGRRARPQHGAPAVPRDCQDPALLARAVDQFVLHYDVCGLSRTCFRVLNERGLSVHFLLDIDGTLYQTMDLRDTGWHATKANDRSVGVEIAHIGARSPKDAAALEEWYAHDTRGPYLDLPVRLGNGGVLTPHFRGRPARPGLIEGRVNGSRLVQYDFTREQYESLAGLARGLTRVLPAIGTRIPRDARGRVAQDMLSETVFENFSGILGHNHIQKNKTDPGPAFDWEWLSAQLR
jgi:N-acetylmuramoyl-L-alanine amidase